MLTQEQRELLVFLHEKDGHSTLTEEQGIVADTMPALVNVTRWGDTIGTLKGKGKMPVWAIEHFPDNPQQAGDWQRITWRFPLHRQVLVVATTRVEGMWKAYCGPVPGMNHDMEEQPVLDYGCDVGEKIGLVLFPHMKGIPYAR
jgi:hypothetical protein